MENETMLNAEDLGFNAEDLKEAGLDNQEPATPASKVPAKEPEDNPADGQTKTEPNPELEPKTEIEPKEPENNPAGGDLKKALAEERARRKAAEEAANTLRSQMNVAQKPVLSPEDLNQIRSYAQQEAARRLKIEDASDLMFTDAQKYQELLHEQARIEYQMTRQQEERQETYQKNVAFIGELKAIPNIGELWQKGTEMLDGMTRKDAAPIDAAFSRIDQGIGTDADFKVIRDFAEKIKSAMAAPAQNPLETAKTLPKASALNGGAPTGAKLSEEEILKYVEEGRENELPTEIRKQIDDLCGD
ncbi:hypothetical protein [Dialister invisus]|uniref:hypothetical protein n=1 Tax=Dialister invisus TaxID=218538 RepID=UPI002E798AB6|nr:hypothetical protein [Dialister invisus]MEE1473491.1 hypothetical protein [Dialister invisus]